MTWEPGYREVPSFDDPPDYEPADDDEYGDDYANYGHDETISCLFGYHLTCPTPRACDCECHQDEAEQAWETYYQPTEGDRGGPDGV